MSALRTPRPRSLAPTSSVGDRETGQALVETALMLPLLLLLLLGLLDLGRAHAMQIALANAAREGARYCALHPGDTAGTRTRVTQELGGLVAADTNAVQCPTVARRQAVTVTVSASFSPFTPMITTITGGAIRLESPATMVVW